MGEGVGDLRRPLGSRPYCPVCPEMAQWNVDHRVFAVEHFFKNNESVVTVQRLFRQRFNVARDGPIPDRRSIQRWVTAFRTTGSVLNIKPTGRPRTAVTPGNVESVRASVLQSPRRSTRRRAATLGLSRRSLQRILHSELKFHPYKIMITQKLYERDYEQRRRFCERMLDVLHSEDVVLIMSDEAHFHLDGYVNKQNCRYWAAENPRQLHQKPLHSTKVTVWCGISKLGIVGPYFFEENGATVTVNSVRYVNMLRNFLRPELQRLRLRLRVTRNQMWFQQDGATAHTAADSMSVVKKMFPKHVISRFGDVHWPARSPDLSACDFFLWGLLKSKVYINKPRTLDELKDAIRSEVAAIERETVVKVMENFEERLLMCINEEGRHLPEVIFRK